MGTEVAETVKDWAIASGALLAAVKEAIPFLPKGNKEKVEKLLAQAEVDYRTARAYVARDLGYPLCAAPHFPPAIMLRKPDGALVCEECGNMIPPPAPAPIKLPESGQKEVHAKARWILLFMSALKSDPDPSDIAGVAKLLVPEVRMHLEDLENLGLIARTTVEVGRLYGPSIGPRYRITTAGTRLVLSWQGSPPEN
jgi:hypothetical protein